MPAVTPGSTVLVTGASGFIAAHVVEHLLNAGFNVRGTVRSKDKGEYLVNLFKNQSGAKFDYVIVDDITKPGVFDEAVKGVDAVAHTASPFYITNVASTEELIGPAVKGTQGVLGSVHKHNPNVKRVVITSSVAAVMSLAAKPPTTFTEKDWNDYAIEQVETKGKDAGGHLIYQASKTYAEKAGWKFLEDNKPAFDIATINPPFVLGPIIHQVDSVESLNTSVAVFHAWASGKKTEDDLPVGLGNWVDVRDIAEAHVKALTVPEAGGERFITGAGPFTGQDIVDVLHRSFPDLKNVPVGTPGTGPEERKKLNVMDGSKAERVLGIRYHAFEDTIKDMAHSLQERFGLQ